MTDSKAFGKLLKLRIANKGMNEDNFAKKIGTSRSKLDEWESGVNAA